MVSNLLHPSSSSLNSRAVAAATVVAALYGGLGLVFYDGDWFYLAGTTTGLFVGVVAMTRPIFRDMMVATEGPIVPSEQYGLAVSRVVGVGALWLAALGLLGSVVGGLLSAIIEEEMMTDGGETLDEALGLLLAGYLSGIFAMVGAYFVGRWIGYRRRERGLLSLILAVALARVSLVLSDASVLGLEVMDAYYLHAGLGSFQLIMSIVLWTTIGLFGYWRGTKMREVMYLYYLVRNLPSDTRKSLVDLAQSEAS